MEASQKVVRENVEIITSLLNQDYVGGLGRSTRALGMVQRILMEQDAAGSQSRYIASPETATSSFRLQSVALPESPSSAALDGPVALFNRAIWFECRSAHGSPFAGPGRGDDIVLAAVLLYNTGLLYHIQALKEGVGSNQLLKIAMSIYTQVSNLLWSEPGETICPDTNDVSLLTLALMNNMAHIHSQWMDLHNVWDCLEDVEDELNCLGDSCYRYLTEEEYIFFTITSAFGSAGESFKGCPAA